jgi:hypothetical protein
MFQKLKKSFFDTCKTKKQLNIKLKLVVASILSLNSLSAQINSVVPTWVSQIDIKTVPQVSKKQITDGYYYVLLDEQRNNEKKHGFYHYAVCAINEEALTNVSQIEFSYDPSYEKAVLHKAIIHRNGEVIDKTKTLTLKELNEETERNVGILNGRKTLYANLSDVRKGDILEYSYSIIGDNPIMKNYFAYRSSVSFSSPVGRIYYRYVFPKECKVIISKKNTTLKPTISKGETTEYVWQIDNPTVLYTESNVPSWYNAYGEIQLSNINTWEEVKAHCMNLFKLENYDTKEINRIADSIKEKYTSTDDQITASVDFVQTHIRYSGNENGIYSHIPRKPDFVLKNRYGDCKEKTVLLNELLKRFNIEAFPVLINTYYGSHIKEEYPGIMRFDHTISGFVFEGKNHFIDPTISYQRGAFINRGAPLYEMGMALSNNHPTFVEIPIDTKAKTEVDEYFYIRKSNDVELTVKTVYKGSNADNLRYYFLTNSIDEVQENYKKYYAKYGEKIEVIDSIKYEDDVEENKFTTTEVYLLPNFWSPEDSTKSKEISKAFLPYVLNDRLTYGDVDKRKDPLSIAYPVNIKHIIRIYEDGTWDFKSEIKKENNAFFNYSYSRRVNDKEMILEYNYSSKKSVIMPQEYKLFKEKMEFVNDNITFSTSQQPLVEGTNGFNWVLLLTMIGATLACAIAIFYLNKRKYQTLYENRYDSVGGWLVLILIGFAISPFMLIFTMYRLYADEFSVDYLVFFFDEKSPFFNPLRGYYFLYNVVINVSLFCFSIYLLVLLTQRKNKFRLYYCVYKTATVFFLFLDIIFVYSFYGDSSNTEERILVSSSTTLFARQFIMACIWVPYIWISERSKHTFTEGNEIINDNNNMKDLLADNGFIN